MSLSMRYSWVLVRRYSRLSPVSYQRRVANSLCRLQDQPLAAPAAVKLILAAFAPALNKATRWSPPATGAASSRAVRYRHAIFSQQEKWRTYLLSAQGRAASLLLRESGSNTDSAKGSGRYGVSKMKLRRAA